MFLARLFFEARVMTVCRDRSLAFSKRMFRERLRRELLRLLSPFKVDADVLAEVSGMLLRSQNQVTTGKKFDSLGYILLMGA